MNTGNLITTTATIFLSENLYNRYILGEFKLGLLRKIFTMHLSVDRGRYLDDDTMVCLDKRSNLVGIITVKPNGDYNIMCITGKLKMPDTMFSMPIAKNVNEVQHQNFRSFFY